MWMKLKIAIDHFKNLEKSKLHIYKDIMLARYKLQKMIISKKRAFFENKLTEYIGKPKDYRRL